MEWENDGETITLYNVDEITLKLETKTRSIRRNNLAAKVLSSIWRKLKSKIQRIKHNTSTEIHQDDVRNYHFHYDPETNELNLYDSKISD